MGEWEKKIKDKSKKIKVFHTFADPPSLKLRRAMPQDCMTARLQDNFCPDGGIGRRAGLKHQWQQCCAGSIPAPGTEKEMRVRASLETRSHSHLFFL
jgi:hypothetical protein